MPAASKNIDSPATTGQAHERQQPSVTICRDVMGGTINLREKGSEYLPQFPQELDKSYNARLSQSVLFNAFARTVKCLVGMIFRNDPQPTEEVPEVMKEHLDDIDLQGRSLPVFARDAFNDAMVDGHVYILVDFPETEEGEIRTLADERDKGLRPYWISIPKQDVLSFRTRQEQGRTVLIQTCIYFRNMEEDGLYREKEVERIRVYRVVDQGIDEEAIDRHVAWELWQKNEEKAVKDATEDKWYMVKFGRLTRPDIPLVAIYVNRAEFFDSEPPLLDLAIENIKHYQLRSDADNVQHIASVPIPWFSGLDEDRNLTVGSNTGILLPVDGKAGYLEPMGHALKAGRDNIQDVEQRMAALGLAMLQRQTRQAETAQAKMIDKAESDSALAAAAVGLENGLNECLQIHADWIDGVDKGGKVTVNKDFMAQMMDPRMVEVISKLVGIQQLSLETMWDMLVRGEVLPATFDMALELERIESASEAELAAMVALAETERKRRADEQAAADKAAGASNEPE